MSTLEINDLARQIEALEPQTREIVLRYLDALEQAAENQKAAAETNPAI